MKQYYYIFCETVPYSMDSQKLIFNSFKELKKYVVNDIKYCMDEYPLTDYLKEKYDIKKVYKRIYVDKIHEYDDTDRGYRFMVYYKDNKGDYGEYIEYYCKKVTKKDMWKYANFKEIN